MYERERTEKLGINDYMTKPVDADELISRLDHHCVDDGGGL
jgi:DNA-binding response OmpR family regulator